MTNQEAEVALVALLVERGLLESGETSMSAFEFRDLTDDKGPLGFASDAAFRFSVWFNGQCLSEHFSVDLHHDGSRRRFSEELGTFLSEAVVELGRPMRGSSDAITPQLTTRCGE
jgi:hypothetical protein